MTYLIYVETEQHFYHLKMCLQLIKIVHALYQLGIFYASLRNLNLNFDKKINVVKLYKLLLLLNEILWLLVNN